MAQQLESKIMNAAMLAIGQRRDVIVNRQHVGKYRALFGDAVISIGTPGMADLSLAVSVCITPEMVGKIVAIACEAEFKTHKAGSKQSDQQRLRELAFNRVGGVYRVCRSPDDLVQLVEDVKNGKW